ncbi:MAG TPA: ketoacyl-ACP synthase III [Bacteroidetes bacterium]|nr:ketoacyl-ACP synthase III [Bacteroidota bacterium]
MTSELLKPASRIAGMGRSVPERVLTNADFEKMVETSDEWITARTGIKRRHVVEPGTPTSDLCTDASRKALAQAGLTPDQVDLIIIGTVTGDAKFPSTANFVQSKLGAYNAATFDIGAACSGFLYALEIGDNAIRAGRAKVVLAIGSEILSSVTDYSDRTTCVLFGDGAGAAVIVPTEDDSIGILSTHTGSNGDLAHLLYCHGGGSLKPGKDPRTTAEDFYLRMAGNEVFKHAVRTMAEAAEVAMKRAKLTPEQIDLLVPHQANMRIIDATAKRFGFSRDKVLINIDEYGNTSSASIPIALDEARERGRIKPGTTVLAVAFGGGFTWGSAVIRF